jgi:UDP-GlcNAc:undecaprenyl-phosphate GlcNAc-1-phosphate transferase
MELAVALTLIITLLFILALRPVALAIRLIDAPGGRKTHNNPTPVIGGIAMYLGLVFGGVLLRGIPNFELLLMGASLLIVIGAIDDRFELPASVRLIAQTCATLVMIYAAGLKLDNIGSPLFFDFELGSFSVPFTILVTLTVINAFNVIDGIDGLAGGVAFIALGFMATISFGSAIFGLILLLMAIVTGFLMCNAPLSSNEKVKCFMGDSGSTFLGFAVAWLGISLSQGESNMMSAVTGLWLVAVPLYDVITSMFRRIFKRQSPFRPDRDHFHHVLMRNGWSARMALGIILALTCVTASIGIIGEIFSIPDTIMFLLWLTCGVAYFEDVANCGGRRIDSFINMLLGGLVSPTISQHSKASSFSNEEDDSSDAPRA